MIFIPGMRPGNVSGAAGRSARKVRGPRLVSGGAYSGEATPKGTVPFEMPRTDDGRKARAEKDARARDVAAALHFHRDSPVSAQEKLKAIRAAAAEVKV